MQIMHVPTIYLASASPRRHELLGQLGIVHQVLDVPPPPGADEPMREGEPAALYVRRTAREKAVRVLAWIKWRALPAWPVLCADTTVIFQCLVLAQPACLADAALDLRTLSGQVHQVTTEIAHACHGHINEDVWE